MLISVSLTNNSEKTFQKNSTKRKNISSQKNLFTLKHEFDMNLIDLETHIKNIFFDKESDIDKIYTLVYQYIKLYSSKKINELNEEIKLIREKKIISVIDSTYNQREINANIEKINYFEQSLTNFQKEVKQLIKKLKKSQNMENLYKFNIYVESLIDIIFKYCDIRLEKVIQKDNICENCGYDVEFPLMIKNENICPECGCLIYSIESFNCTNNNDYDERDNFYLSLIQLQGIQTVNNFPTDLEEKLDNYFTKNNCPTGKEIRKQVHNNKGEKNGTSVKKMKDALKVLNMKKHYENLRLICNKYWGWKMIIIDKKLENEIMNDYDQVLFVYNTLEKNRSSKINNQYMLWWLLQKNGINIGCDELSFIKTRKTLEYYENIRRIICKILNWEFKRLL